MGKVFKIMIIVIGCFLVMGIGGIYSLARAAQEIDTTIKENEQQHEMDKDSLEVDNIHQSGDTISGTITNTLDYNINDLTIKFKFFKDGITIHEDFDIKSDFLPGETWEFNIYLFDQEFDKYTYELEMLVY